MWCPSFRRSGHRSCRRAISPVPGLRPAQFLCLHGASPCSLYAVESLKQVRQCALWNSRTRVANLQLDRVADRFYRHRNLALKCEFESVRDEIQNNLLPHITIDENRLGEWLACDLVD